jgi:hypothetical protein
MQKNSPQTLLLSSNKGFGKCKPLPDYKSIIPIRIIFLSVSFCIKIKLHLSNSFDQKLNKICKKNYK